MQTRREAALGCAIVVVLLSVGAAFAGDVTLLLPVMVALPAVAVTAALLHRGSLIDAADVSDRVVENPEVSDRLVRECRAVL